MRNSGKKWREKEINYLSTAWSNLVGVETISKHLGRSKAAILIKINKLKLGGFKQQNYEYFGFYELSKLLNLNASYMNKLINAGFPLERKKINKSYYKFVNIEKLIKWLETDNNKHLVTFKNCEKGDLYYNEPSWFEEKRKSDKLLAKYNTSKWTSRDDAELINLLDQYKFSYSEISKRLRRYESAIKRRILDLKLKPRPLKKPVLMWSEYEVNLVKKLYQKGYHSIIIRDLYLPHRTQLGINGILERNNYFLSPERCTPQNYTLSFFNEKSNKNCGLVGQGE